MENLMILPNDVKIRRSNNQQLKVIMNLPVRLVSEEQTIDVLPLAETNPARPTGQLEAGGPTLTVQHWSRVPGIKELFTPPVFPTCDELITFFKGCEIGDLIRISDLAAFTGIAQSTLNRWTMQGIVKKYVLTQSLTVFKISELPDSIFKALNQNNG